MTTAVSGNLMFQGFLYHNGVVHLLHPLPGGTDSLAHGINNHGMIAGEASGPFGPEAVVFDKAGNPHPLPVFANSALAINDAGQVLAQIDQDANTPGDAVLFNPDGKVQDLGPLLGGPALTAAGLNSRGDVIANLFNQEGLLVSGGKVITVGALTNPAHAIGAGTDASNRVAGINDLGQVVGASSYAAPNFNPIISRPILFQNGVTRDLSLSVDPAVSQHLASAEAINNRGVVLATKLDDNFAGRSVLLKPIAGGSISGVVYHDDNANGTRQKSERGLFGRTVYIDANNNGILDYGEQSTITTGGGAYSFAYLAPGHYVIREVLPLGRQTGPAGARVVDLKAAQRVTGQDFGVTGSPIGWRVIDLGTLRRPATAPDDAAQSFAMAINDSGQIVGQADLSPLTPGGVSYIHHAFLYTGGRMIDITPQLNGNSTAYGINNKGQVVGEIDKPTDFGSLPHAFFYSTGKLQPIPTPKNSPAVAYAINDAAVAVGELDLPAYPGDSEYQRQVAARFRGGSSDLVLDALNTFVANFDAAGGARAIAVNSRGDIVGTAVTGPFRGGGSASMGEMIINGKAILVGGGDGPSSVSALNDHGDAVGILNGSSFLYTQGKFHLLDRLAAASGGALATVNGLNNSDELVGGGTSTNFSSIYDDGNHAMILLNGQLIDPNFALVNGGGWVIQSAAAVNNRGWIAANAITPNGEAHAVILIPADASA